MAPAQAAPMTAGEKELLLGNAATSMGEPEALGLVALGLEVTALALELDVAEAVGETLFVAADDVVRVGDEVEVPTEVGVREGVDAADPTGV